MQSITLPALFLALWAGSFFTTRTVGTLAGIV